MLVLLMVTLSPSIWGGSGLGLMAMLADSDGALPPPSTTLTWGDTVDERGRRVIVGRSENATP